MLFFTLQRRTYVETVTKNPIILITFATLLMTKYCL